MVIPDQRLSLHHYYFGRRKESLLRFSVRHAETQRSQGASRQKSRAKKRREQEPVRILRKNCPTQKHTLSACSSATYIQQSVLPPNPGRLFEGQLVSAVKILRRAFRDGSLGCRSRLAVQNLQRERDYYDPHTEYRRRQ